MKKIAFIFIALMVFLVSCANDSSSNDNQSEKETKKQTLKELIEQTPSGGEIDLGKNEIILSDINSYTISKPLTIKNGAVNDAIFTLESSGVIFENLSDVKTVTVSSKIEDGDFTLKNCTTNFTELIVNGGGSNSIHIQNSIIKKLTINKKDVRLAISNNSSTKIAQTQIFSNCTLEAVSESNTNNENLFENVIVSSSVEKLEIKGKTSIGQIISSSEQNEIEITLSNETKIKKTDNVLKDKFKIGNQTITFSGEIITDDEKEYILGKELNCEFENSEDSIIKPTFLTTDDVLKITNPNQNKDDYSKIWDCSIYTKENLSIKKGKNYEISVDLKTDTEEYVSLQINDIVNKDAGSTSYEKITTNWKTYTLKTGVAPADWKKGKFKIAMNTVSNLYIKNLRLTEIDDKSFETCVWCPKKDELGTTTIQTTEKTARIKFTKETNSSWIRFAPSIILDFNKLYKVTFDITTISSEKDDDLTYWVQNRIIEPTYSTMGGSGGYTFEKGTTKVTTYISTARYTDEQTYCQPFIEFSETKPREFEVSNIEFTEISLETMLDENPYCDFYVSVSIAKNGEEYKYIRTRNNTQIPILAGEEGWGEFYFGDYDGWETKENFILQFKTLSAKTKEGLITGRQNVKFIFKNTSDKIVNLKFSLDDEYKTLIEAEEFIDDGTYSGKLGDDYYFRYLKDENLEIIEDRVYDIRWIEDNFPQNSYYKLSIPQIDAKIRDEQTNLTPDDFTILLQGDLQGDDDYWYWEEILNKKYDKNTEGITEYIKLNKTYNTITISAFGSNLILTMKDIFFEKITEAEYNANITE